MLSEPTTLAATARLIAETLEKQYQVDSLEVFRKAGIDPQRLNVAGARYPWRNMQSLWLEAVRATKDPAFGITVGANIRPTTFHALGFSWLATRTLLESLQRLCRYHHLISNAPFQLELYPEGDLWALELKASNRGNPEASAIASDALAVAIIRLCRKAKDKHVHAEVMYCTAPAPDDIDVYVRMMECPVFFDQPRDALTFSKELLESPLPGDNLELAIANDRIAEEYILALEPERISSEVRKLLIELLPSGDANQESIAKQLNRSLSTLQRQLSAEGTNYKEIREQTRAELAERYVREGRCSLSQIAYLLGFSDQSNFSRAFRRWTRHSPGSYGEC